MTDPLRRLDERIVPALAQFFDRLIPRPPEPSGPLPVILRLRRVDDRWTQRGPLALLREVPQLGALAIGALVLASGVTVKARTETTQRGDAREAEQGPGAPGEDRLRIGPEIGQNVPEYIEEARKRLLDAGPGQPDASAVAVVSFAQYRTARQVQDLVGPAAAVVRIFYRVPVTPLPEPAPAESTVTNLLTDSKKEFLRVAIAHEAAIKELQSVIDTNDHDPVQKAADEVERDRLRREARALRGDCACIYGVIVQTKLRVLVGLVDNPGVRVIDISAADARLGDYEDYAALLPEEKVTVTGGDQA